jgi:hypothetical protein
MDERLELDANLDRLFNWDFFDEITGNEKSSTEAFNMTPGNNLWCRLMEEFPNWLYGRFPELKPEFNQNQQSIDMNNERFCMLGNPIVYTVFWIKSGNEGLFGRSEEAYAIIHPYQTSLNRGNVDDRHPLYLHPRVYKIPSGNPSVMNEYHSFIIESQDGSMRVEVDYNDMLDPFESKPVMTSDDLPERFLAMLDEGVEFNSDLIKDALMQVYGHTDAYFLQDDDNAYCPPNQSPLLLRLHQKH